jgi:hypothetical protein
VVMPTGPCIPMMQECQQVARNCRLPRCSDFVRKRGFSRLSANVTARTVGDPNLPSPACQSAPPFYRDKQEYQAPGVENWYPIFANEVSELRIRFNVRPIRRGYEKTGRVLNNEGAEAVGLLNGFLSDPRHRHDFWMERGQIQILNNRIVVHGRTPYVDFDEPERHRHLIRLWLRAGDRRQFRG